MVGSVRAGQARLRCAGATLAIALGCPHHANPFRAATERRLDDPDLAGVRAAARPGQDRRRQRSRVGPVAASRGRRGAKRRLGIARRGRAAEAPRIDRRQARPKSNGRVDCRDVDPIWAPVIATAIGGAVAACTAYAVARVNIDGQRQLAQDRARLEWRLEVVRPLLDLATQRANLYIRLSDALEGPHPERAEAIIEDLNHLPTLAVYGARLRRTVPKSLVKAILELYRADNRSMEALEVLRQGTMVTPEFAEALRKSGADLSVAIGDVHAEAELLLFGPDRPPGRSIWRRG
jgi:hypothetical protein